MRNKISVEQLALILYPFPPFPIATGTLDCDNTDSQAMIAVVMHISPCIYAFMGPYAIGNERVVGAKNDIVAIQQ